MRRALALLVVLGCEPRFVPTPLPELAAAREPRAIAVRALRLAPGETMIWDVSMHGLTIGRAELVVGASDARSAFRTAGLASSIASVKHELITGLDRANAAAASQTETLVLDGATTRADVTFDRSSYTSSGRVVALP